MRSPIVILTLGSILAAAATKAAAQPSTAFSYQGVLRDDGSPANATYDINFTLRAGPSGLTNLGSIFIEDIPCTDGLFTVELDFAQATADYQDLWLKLAIRDGDSEGLLLNLPTLMPLRAAPRAVRANTASALDAPNLTPIPGDPGGAVAPAIRSVVYPEGGGLDVLDTSGNTTLEIKPGQFGVSSDLTITADPAEPWYNIHLAGDPFDLDAPHVSITGPASGVTINTHIPGGNSVILPDNAVNPNEILAEPGLATTSWNSGFGVGSSPITIASVTIDPPTPGYVLVIASAEVDFNQGATETASFRMGISETTDAMPSDAPSIVPNSYSDLQSLQTWHRIFPVTSVQRTFHLVGQVSGTFNVAGVDKGQITAIYLPTAYGNAPALLQPEPNPKAADPTISPSFPAFPSEIELLRRELADLRDKVNRLEHD